MATEELDDLQSKHMACKTLAFADLSTKMILVTNSNTSFQREALDTLCEEALLTLGTIKKIAVGGTPSSTAFVATKDQVRIFLRSPNEPTDVLCCVCSPDVDIPSFMNDARPCLEKISGGF